MLNITHLLGLQEGGLGTCMHTELSEGRGDWGVTYGRSGNGAVL